MDPAFLSLWTVQFSNGRWPLCMAEKSTTSCARRGAYSTRKKRAQQRQQRHPCRQRQQRQQRQRRRRSSANVVISANTNQPTQLRPRWFGARRLGGALNLCKVVRRCTNLNELLEYCLPHDERERERERNKQRERERDRQIERETHVPPT